MQSGLYWGYVGLVEGIIRRMREEEPSVSRVVATGALAPLDPRGDEVDRRRRPRADAQRAQAHLRAKRQGQGPARLMRLAVTLAGLLVAAPLFGGGTTTSKNAAVATGSRYATNAALAVLRDGGNAADAAIAAAFVLSVARPDAAGIGGGGMLVYHDREHNANWVVDFREAAPAKLPVVPKDGPLTGVSAAAMPGLVRGLAETHRRFGSRPWKELVLPASRLAEEGFVVDETLSASIARNLETNHFDPRAIAIFAPEQKAPASGQRLVQKQLAAIALQDREEPQRPGRRRARRRGSRMRARRTEACSRSAISASTAPRSGRR